MVRPEGASRGCGGDAADVGSSQVLSRDAPPAESLHMGRAGGEDFMVVSGHSAGHGTH